MALVPHCDVCETRIVQNGVIGLNVGYGLASTRWDNKQTVDLCSFACVKRMLIKIANEVKVVGP